jgi:hypothetical protein
MTEHTQLASLLGRRYRHVDAAGDERIVVVVVGLRIDGCFLLAKSFLAALAPAPLHWWGGPPCYVLPNSRVIGVYPLRLICLH